MPRTSRGTAPKHPRCFGSFAHRRWRICPRVRGGYRRQVTLCSLSNLAPSLCHVRCSSKAKLAAGAARPGSVCTGGTRGPSPSGRGRSSGTAKSVKSGAAAAWAAAASFWGAVGTLADSGARPTLCWMLFFPIPRFSKRRPALHIRAFLPSRCMIPRDGGRTVFIDSHRPRPHRPRASVISRHFAVRGRRAQQPPCRHPRRRCVLVSEPAQRRPCEPRRGLRSSRPRSPPNPP